MSEEPTLYDVEYYDSIASRARTGPGTGMNAPDDGTGRWYGSYPMRLPDAEARFDRWTNEPDYFKRCRIVRCDSKTSRPVVRDSINQFPLAVVV